MLNRGATFRRGAGFPAWLLFVALAALSVSCARPPQAGNGASPTPQTAAASASPIPWGTIEPPAHVGHPVGSPKPLERAPVSTHSGVGVILSINLKDGWFEIDHEDIAGYMPAMHMQWSVKDRAILKSVKVGDRVTFKVRNDNGTEVITELKKADAK